MAMHAEIVAKAKERDAVLAKIVAVFAEYEKEKNAAHEKPERLQVSLPLPIYLSSLRRLMRRATRSTSAIAGHCKAGTRRSSRQA